MFTYEINFSPKLKCFKAFLIKDHLNEAKAFSKSIVKSTPAILSLVVRSKISSISLILVPINRPLMYPVWSSSMINGNTFSNLFANALAKIL